MDMRERIISNKHGDSFYKVKQLVGYYTRDT